MRPAQPIDRPSTAIATEKYTSSPVASQKVEMNGVDAGEHLGDLPIAELAHEVSLLRGAEAVGDERADLVRRGAAVRMRSVVGRLPDLLGRRGARRLRIAGMPWRASFGGRCA